MRLPDGGELAAMPLHVVVRDLPETLENGQRLGEIPDDDVQRQRRELALVRQPHVCAGSTPAITSTSRSATSRNA